MPGNVSKNTMLKLLVIIIAAIAFVWYIFPQFADESLESYVEENYEVRN
jgi:hypothetical protein